MAALVRHGVFKTRSLPSPAAAAAAATTARNVWAGQFSTKAEKKKGIDRKLPPKIDHSAESIAAKGFLRTQKSYDPPENVAVKFEEIVRNVLGKEAKAGNRSIQNLNQKFVLFTACEKEFQHSVPNSLLHEIETVDDLKKFYSTPICTKTPLDKMRNLQLPENLHVQFDYHRFHPDTDTMFGRQTAFNRSSTLVTGLKYKDKYKGHLQNQTWPYNS